MDKPISVGDLVVVVRTDCCPNDLGKIFRVTAIRFYRECECTVCRRTLGDTMLYVDRDAIGYARDEIRLIPPLGELENEKRDEEITA